MNTTAVIYARYSSDKQTEQSIDGQLRICNEFADRLGFRVVESYIDRRITGTTANCPEFQRMIKDSAKKGFQIVIVYKMDRFSRNRYDSAIYKNKLKKNGVSVISATENIGNGSEAIILEAMLEAMAEVYSRQLGENVRRGMKETALKANNTGGTTPLGYRVVEKRLAIDPATAPYVKTIFEMYADGFTKRDIIERVAAQGYRKKNGKPLTIQNITHILQNKKYIGVFHYNDIEIENGCPAIIEKTLFDRASKRAEISKKAYGQKRTEKVEFILLGKLYCGYCGASMAGDSGTSRNGEKHCYYSCHNRKNRRRTGIDCKKISEKKDYIEWYIVEQTVEYLLMPNRLEFIAKKVVEFYRSEYDTEKLASLKKRLAQIDKDIYAAVDALIKTSHQAAIDRINDNIGDLEVQKREAEEVLLGLQAGCNVHITEQQVIDIFLLLHSIIQGPFSLPLRPQELLVVHVQHKIDCIAT